MASLSQETTNGTLNCLKLLELQPLKDLAKNFDIDVASCLEEFLHELLPDEHDLHVDSETLNFAKAALAVQNSACIYSRKVEYLYSLTHKVIADMSDSDTKKRSNNKETEAMDEYFDQLEDPEFLLLDDIPVDTKKQKELKSSRWSLSSRLSISTTSHNNETTANLSHSSIELSRYSNPSQANARASVRELMRSMADSNGLRVSNSRMSMDGGLFLHGILQAGPQQPLFHLADGLAACELQAEGSFVVHHDEYDHDDNDNDGAGFEFGGDDADHAVDHRAMESQKKVSFAPATMFQNDKKKEDYWEMLDENTDTAKPKPLRIGKTIKLPAGVDIPPSECVTGARTRRTVRRAEMVVPFSGAPLCRSLATETFQATLRKRNHSQLDSDDDSDTSVDKNDIILPMVPLKGLYFGNEFAYIAKATAKRRAAERRELRKQEQADTNNIPQKHSGAYVEEDDEEGDTGGGFAFGGDFDDDDDNDFGGGAFGADDDQVESNTGLATFDDAFQRSTGNDLNDADSDHFTFEELCQVHQKNLKEYTEKYMNQSQLSKRVDDWQQRIIPFLEEEGKRPAFDIYGYGQSVIELAEKETRRLSVAFKDSDDMDEDTSNRIDFREVTRHQPQHEICRLFLATLSLCCSGNVEVVDNTGGDGSSLTIKLIHTKIDTPMDQYIAPSAAEREH